MEVAYLEACLRSKHSCIKSVSACWYVVVPQLVVRPSEDDVS